MTDKPIRKFYDVRTKTKFSTKDYVYRTKGKTEFAVAKHNGKECWVIIGRK